MKFKIKKEDHIKLHLRLMNGFLNLTAKETEILIEFVRAYYDLSNQISNKDLVNSQLFSSSSRRKIRDICKISSENLFNNYFGSLKKKKVIQPAGDSYSLNEKILPKQKIVFEVEYTN